MGLTSIEWTATVGPDGTVHPGMTFNPWLGCQKVSPGCEHCYAERFDARKLRSDETHWGPKAPRLFQSDEYWRQPLRWNRRAQHLGVRLKVFCASMADVFEDRRDLDPWRARLWALIRETPHLDWLLLTKRPENFCRMLPRNIVDNVDRPAFGNVWLGVTAEDQQRADERIPLLLATPTVVHFVSYEPALGPANFRPYLITGASAAQCQCGHGHGFTACPNYGGVAPTCHNCDCPGFRRVRGTANVDWIIAGGESGPGARPMDLDWARAVRDQCRDAGAPFFLKQLGGVALKRGGELALLDGQRHMEFPR